MTRRKRRILRWSEQSPGASASGDLFVLNIFRDILYLAVENPAQLVQRVGTHIFILPEAVELARAELVFPEQAVLGNALPLHGSPQPVIDNQIASPSPLLHLCYILANLLTIAHIRAIVLIRGRDETLEKGIAPDPNKRAPAYRMLNGLTDIGPLTGCILEEREQIDRLVNQIYQHRLRLCNRVHMDFEDRDMEAIIKTYEQLNRLCADLMYNQGWFDAANT